MDFNLSREHQLIRKMMADFTETEVKPIAAETDRTSQYPRENIEKLFDLGVMGMCVPKEYGGAGADVLAYAKENNCSVVVGTTGHTPEEKELIFRAAECIPVFYAGNVSLGIAVLCRLVKQAVAFFPDAEIEIVETHHDRKIDAPSGTAMMLYREIAAVRDNAPAKLGRSGIDKRNPGEIGIHAVRMGNIVGEHEVIVGTDTQTITLKHEAHSRALFAEGALAAAAYLCGKGWHRREEKRTEEAETVTDSEVLLFAYIRGNIAPFGHHLGKSADEIEDKLQRLFAVAFSRKFRPKGNTGFSPDAGSLLCHPRPANGLHGSFLHHRPMAVMGCLESNRSLHPGNRRFFRGCHIPHHILCTFRMTPDIAVHGFPIFQNRFS